jgi:hypothetical protein
MDHKSQISPFEETLKGNVRIRLHCFDTDDCTKYGVELSAYNSWAGQWKLLLFQGGMDRTDADVMVEELAARIRGFDWHADDFLLE